MKTEKFERNAAGSGKNEGQTPARKKYKAPSLTVYGDIAELTQGTNTGSFDDGAFGHTTVHLAPIRRTPTPHP